jgi:hypothetical protein
MITPMHTQTLVFPLSFLLLYCFFAFPINLHFIFIIYNRHLNLGDSETFSNLGDWETFSNLGDWETFSNLGDSETFSNLGDWETFSNISPSSKFG